MSNMDTIRDEWLPRKHSLSKKHDAWYTPRLRNMKTQLQYVDGELLTPTEALSVMIYKDAVTNISGGLYSE